MSQNIKKKTEYFFDISFLFFVLQLYGTYLINFSIFLTFTNFFQLGWKEIFQLGWKEIFLFCFCDIFTK